MGMSKWGQLLKWWVSPTISIGFPTIINDQHLGCEIGLKLPFFWKHPNGHVFFISVYPPPNQDASHLHEDS